MNSHYSVLLGNYGKKKNCSSHELCEYFLPVIGWVGKCRRQGYGQQSYGLYMHIDDKCSPWLMVQHNPTVGGGLCGVLMKSVLSHYCSAHV